MANVDSPFGLRAIGSANGAPVTGAVIPCYIAATYETALFKGDPVVVVAAGSNSAREGDTIEGDLPIGSLPAVERATVTDGGTVSGVIVGFAHETQDSLLYSPADTEAVAYVNIDPNTLYEIQADGAVAATSVGLNAVGIYTNSGDTTYGYSGLELDSGTTTAPSADASNPFTIERIISAPDNEPNAAFNKVVVRINSSTRADGAIGV